MKGAPILLLDEPFVSLDYNLREGMGEELSAPERWTRRGWSMIPPVNLPQAEVTSASVMLERKIVEHMLGKSLNITTDLSRALIYSADDTLIAGGAHGGNPAGNPRA